MKKILIALAALVSVQLADAQVKSPADAVKAVESAEKAAENPKKAAKPVTWIKLGNAYIESYNSPAGNAYTGASHQELQFLMPGQTPSATETVELMNEPYQKEVYEDKNLYFNQGGQLAIIEVTKYPVENALVKAYEAFEKAASVDASGSKTKDVVAGLKTIGAKYLEAGMNQYMLGNIPAASENFCKASDISLHELVNAIDTTATYNAGFTAWMTQDYEKAIPYFQKCIEANYLEGGEVYAKLSDCYDKLGNKEEAKNTLESGFKAYPQSQSILIGLINFYVQSGDNTTRLFELLDEAKKNEPNNASLYYVEGNIHNELGNIEAAVASYNKCNEIDPNYEFGFIGAGVMYYNLAIELQEKAQNELDDTKYMKLVEDFEAALKNAIEPFEKAYAISKDNELRVNIAEYLKNIYFRFRSQDESYNASYEKYNEVVASGVAK